VRVAQLELGRRVPEGLEGAILTRDLVVAGARWSKGRRLSSEDLVAIAEAPPHRLVTVLLLEPGDVHEDDAAVRLAAAIGGGGLTSRGPVQSRVDLHATEAGILHVRIRDLERINGMDPLEVFTAYDGSAVGAGDLVASVKIAPHVVDTALIAAIERLTRAGRRPIVRVASYRAMRVGVIVKESLRAADRDRFERSVRVKVEALGSRLTNIAYVADTESAVVAALRTMAAGRGPWRVDVILTAGGRSTDPLDPFFTAIAELGGRVVRHGVPAHPGSMLWLARIGSTGILGLPTCGAYSKATAADLVLPRLLTGEPAGPRLVAGLGHGGLLTRTQRFRFPSYARELDAPEG
jgi:hypothetical protein